MTQQDQNIDSSSRPSGERLNRDTPSCRTRRAVALLCLALVACAVERDDELEREQAISSVASDITTQSESLIVSDVIRRLEGLQGQYSAPSDNAELVVHTDDLRLFNQIRALGEDVVPTLVACLDSEIPATATMEGKRVPLGVVCMEALERTVIYEATDSSGDIDPTWPGYTLPTSSAEERRAAKAAWLVVVREKAYLLKKDL